MSRQPSSGSDRPKSVRRSGSEMRHRAVVNKFRSTAAERTEMRANAAAAGLSFGSFMRSLGCAHPTTRPVRHRPAPEARLLMQLLGQLGRVAGNIYQLVRAMNFGGIPRSHELDAAGKEVCAFIADMRKAFGL
jgi:hypothetical protein